MKILALNQMPSNPFGSWGLNGYVTGQIWEVAVRTESDVLGFSLKKVDKPYEKHWETSHADLARYEELIGQGHSFGAYEDDELVGWVVGEKRDWNNSFYIEHIMVAERCRGRGIGQKLLQKAIECSSSLGCRMVELETQNTNLPAIDFYLKQGFSITGMNLKLYAAPAEKEVAIFMSYAH